MALRTSLCLAAATLIACGGDDDKKDASTAETTSAPTDTSVAETTPETVETTTDPSDTSAPTEVVPDTTAVTETVETDVADTSTPDVDDVNEVSETSDVETDTSTGPELAGACTLADRYGGFLVVDDGEYGYVTGEIADGVVPGTVLEVVTATAECTLYRKNNPFCSPPCGPTDTCDFDGNCVTYPLPQDLGTVTVKGLEGGDVVMSVGPTYFWTDVPYPPWTAGAPITMTTTGGAFGPLTLTGYGPQTFTPGDTLWTITRGQPLTARWNAPSGDVKTVVELQLLIDQHGNAPASVRCSFADDGEAQVPVAIIDGLLDSGVSGFPSGKLTRQTLDSDAVGDGCAELSVRSPRNVKVTVPGFVPCTKDADCPAGKTCNEAIETCVDL